MMLQEKLADIRAKRANGEGFTLVELLIVVVILVVLAAIAVPIFLNQANKARVAAAKSNVSAVSTAMSTGQSTSGSYTYTHATKTIVVTDGTGATVTVPLGSATLNQPAGTAVTANVASTNLSGATWCIVQATGAGTPADVSMGSANTAPVENATCA